MGEDQLFSRFGREFVKGTVLFCEGDLGQEMFVVQSGLVAISKKVRDIEKVLATLGPGEFFGEMAIISNKPRTATATVTEAARCLVIDSKTFEAMIRSNSEIAVRMIKKLADRLQEADAQIENLLLRDVSSRVAHCLVHAAQTRGKVVPEGTRVDLAVSSLPGALGLEAAQITGVLKRLQSSRLVVVDAEGIVVPDVASLKQFLEFLDMKEKYGDMG